MSKHKIEVIEYRKTSNNPLEGYQVLVYNGKLKENIWFWYNVRNGDIESCDLEYEESPPYHNEPSMDLCDSAGFEHLVTKGIFIRDEKGNWTYPDQIVSE
jgi:hypothetical protein